MRKKDRAVEIAKIFDNVYPDAECSLDYTTDYELLFAVILSAQCTDARVNIVTKQLFKRYKTIEDYANADLDELMGIIKSCGFYKNKAQNIIKCANSLLYDFGSKVPDTMEELTSLAGVGRKTANLILGDVFGKPGVVVDTHCIRLSNRFGLTNQKEPYKIELELSKIIPPHIQSRFCHQIVLHGRAYCKAGNPLCESCPVSEYCKYYGDKTKRR